jgi:hypothetical protein
VGIRKIEVGLPVPRRVPSTRPENVVRRIDGCAQLTWSDWRRRHQARAKLNHYRRRQTIDNHA